MNVRISLLVLLVMIFIPCAANAQENQTLTIFAAASLTDAFEAIAADFEAANPNIDIIFNFGSSSTLAAQLLEGAPADIFASANNRQMQVVQDGGRIVGLPKIFARNRLLLAVPNDNPTNIQSLRDLGRTGIKLVVAAPGVPVSDYTDAMLDLLAADSSYGERYREAFIANIVSEEDNVRQVSAKVALGEADAAIVYLSDITPDIADSVTALPIPDTVNTLATYPIAVTDDSANPELAQAFVNFVLSRRGQSALVLWGFICVAHDV